MSNPPDVVVDLNSVWYRSRVPLATREHHIGPPEPQVPSMRATLSSAGAAGQFGTPRQAAAPSQLLVIGTS